MWALSLVVTSGDELAQVVGCPWIMRDGGGSLAQNRWQGDLGLTAVGQEDTGGGRHLMVYYFDSSKQLMDVFIKIKKLSGLKFKNFNRRYQKCGILLYGKKLLQCNHQ